MPTTHPMRAVASVTLSFGLVSIPVKLYSATDASAAIRFKLMSRAGARVRQQYVADQPPVLSDDEQEGPRSAQPAAAPERKAMLASAAPGPKLALLPSTGRPARGPLPEVPPP